MLALEAMSRLPESKRPIAFETFIRRGQDDPGIEFTELPGHPKTKVMEGVIFEFDRNQKFGFNERLNYNIIANWVAAEHKSQGTMQLTMQNKKGVIEQYWYVELNGMDGISKAETFFNAVNEAEFYQSNK